MREKSTDPITSNQTVDIYGYLILEVRIDVGPHPISKTAAPIRPTLLAQNPSQGHFKNRYPACR